MAAPVLLLLLATGRPLFYWGARAPVVVVRGAPTGGVVARVQEVHLARDDGDVVLRFSFDRPVAEALALPSGRPVSGRLRAILYLDTDADPRTGLRGAPADLRVGCDARLEVGVVALGEDPEEKRPALAVVTAALAGLDAAGRRHVLWRADDAANPQRVSAHGEWVELRVPGPSLELQPEARLVLSEAGKAWEGRLRPEP
jgi:hypothetical protein